MAVFPSRDDPHPEMAAKTIIFVEDTPGKHEQFKIHYPLPVLLSTFASGSGGAGPVWMMLVIYLCGEPSSKGRCNTMPPSQDYRVNFSREKLID